jgi:hypothetical protein
MSILKLPSCFSHRDSFRSFVSGAQIGAALSVTPSPNVSSRASDERSPWLGHPASRDDLQARDNRIERRRRAHSLAVQGKLSTRSATTVSGPMR